MAAKAKPAMTPEAFTATMKELEGLSIDVRIKKLKIKIPAGDLSKPGRLAAVRFDAETGFLFLSGMTAGQGKVGGNPAVGYVSLDDGFWAGWDVGLQILGRLKAAINDFNKVEALLYARVDVNTAPDEGNTPGPGMGFSYLMQLVFGQDVGFHTRTAVGAQVPGNASIEVTTQWKIKKAARASIKRAWF
jgi:hypothetical protein